MMKSSPPPNPFCARAIRAGVREYIFDDGSLDELIDRFQVCGRRGQIVGPHGSGKSTLLYYVVQGLLSRGIHVTMIRLPSRDDPRFPAAVDSWKKALRHPSDDVLAVDGLEQLPGWRRWKFSLTRSPTHGGILITSHRTCWTLPVMYRTSMTRSLAQRIISELLAVAPLDAVDRQSIQQMVQTKLPDLLDQYQGNLREVLMDLYDLSSAVLKNGSLLYGLGAWVPAAAYRRDFGKGDGS